MAVSAGTRLGPYEVSAPLGAGGMGEVYRARDTRLGRDVALKVLPADVAHDADRRARFEREARAVAALSHPNILALHDIGLDADTLFVVTELLDGETLADRLRQGALPVRTAVEIAVAIARGLGAAHEKGIAHRDLKPANIFLLADGQVKILDFGLAKLQDPKTSRPQDLTASPTITSPDLTARGVILGTAGYMAPEQIRGQPVDGRADLFALGIVLYEMLTGTGAFARETTAETLTAILKEDPPDLTTIRAELPPALEHIVRHCLEKSPAQRFQSAQDVVFALETLTGSGATGGALAVVAASDRGLWRSTRLAWAVAALLAVVAGVSAWLPGDVVTPDREATFVALGAPMPEQQFHFIAWPVISPDGRRVAFWAENEGGRFQLWVRDFADASERALPKTELSDEYGDYGTQAAFSPDGRAVAFFASDRLWRMDLDAAQPLALAPAPAPRGVTWGSLDTLVYQPAQGPLMVIPAAGGTPRALTVTTVDDQPRHPSFLPDGRHFLYCDRDFLYVASTDGGPARQVMPARSRAEYANGHLLFVNAGSLYAQRFDLNGHQVVGPPRRLLDHVGAGAGASREGTYSVARNGTLVVWTGRLLPRAQLVWLDRAGRRVASVGRPDHIAGLAASPDRRQLAVEVVDETNNVVVQVHDTEDGSSTRVALDQGQWPATMTPAWSSDGRHLWLGTGDGIVKWPLDGGAPQVVPAGTAWVIDASSDGQWVVLDKTDPSTLNDVWLWPASGGSPQIYLNGPSNERSGRVSPDNRFLAYVSDEPGQLEVFIDAFPARARRIRVSSNGGQWPMWRADGRALYFLSLDNRLMEVSVARSGSELAVSKPIDLFQAPPVNGWPSRPPYVPSADGQRFLFNARMVESIPRVIDVVLNWPALLSP